MSTTLSFPNLRLARGGIRAGVIDTDVRGGVAAGAGAGGVAMGAGNGAVTDTDFSKGT